MWSDPSVQSIMFHETIKGVLLWFSIIWMLVVIYVIFKNGAEIIVDEGQPTTKINLAKLKAYFPTYRFILGILFLVGASLYISYDTPYRQVPGVTNNELVTKRQESIKKEESEKIIDVPPDTKETLAEKSKRMLEQNAKENDKAKENFSNLGVSKNE